MWQGLLCRCSRVTCIIYAHVFHKRLTSFILRSGCMSPCRQISGTWLSPSSTVAHWSHCLGKGLLPRTQQAMSSPQVCMIACSVYIVWQAAALGREMIFKICDALLNQAFEHTTPGCTGGCMIVTRHVRLLSLMRCVVHTHTGAALLLRTHFERVHGAAAGAAKLASFMDLLRTQRIAVSFEMVTGDWVGRGGSMSCTASADCEASRQRCPAGSTISDMPVHDTGLSLLPVGRVPWSSRAAARR
jgi:hypothetical protein